MLTANVFVNIPVKSIAQAYTYRVPDDLSFVGVGWRVFVPFGGRRVEGFVVATAEVEKSERELKDILGVVDEEAWFTPAMLEVAAQLADFYLCAPAEMMRLFMPGKSGLKIEVVYEADEEQENHLILQMAPCRAVYDLLRSEGAKSKTELGTCLPDVKDDLPQILDRLLQDHVIRREYTAAKREKARYEKIVTLTAEVTEDLLAGFTRKKAQRHLLELLREKPEQKFTKLREQKVSLPTVHALEEAGLVTIRARRVLRDSYRSIAAPDRPTFTLTSEQETAVSAVKRGIDAGGFHGYLLHGVTGSGKTQVYIELARQVRQNGRQVIVLVPEIALTGQLVQAFRAYFAGDIVVMHSQLSLTERNDAVFRVRRGEAGIIIGARSALFTPVNEVGLIILDEEQDMSYKQDESPRYHARVVAETIAKIHGAALLLGSATPSLETYYRAQQGEFELLAMPHRIGDMPLPEVKSVDMRRELKTGNRHILSRELQQLVAQTLVRHEQVIIMLNRRGYSTFVMCRSCGEVIKCRECGMPLVYHQNGSLVCHHCDIREPVPTICPKCGSPYIKYFGSGTEKLEQELRTIFPQARVIRMDRDTTGKKFAHQQILEQFRRHEYDILLGTQMVAKGHDIPNVTAVGVISADASLNLPDFRAAERCFMLITQTAGRAGRHGTLGHVIIQTYNPEHYAVTCGIRQDYERFYRTELGLRRELFYPPYSRLVKLLFQNEDEKQCREEATAFMESFLDHFQHDARERILGPSPAIIARFRGVYRFVVLIKAGDLTAVQDFLRQKQMHLRTDVAIDIDPITIL